MFHQNRDVTSSHNSKECVQRPLVEPVTCPKRQHTHMLVVAILTIASPLRDGNIISQYLYTLLDLEFVRREGVMIIFRREGKFLT